MTFDGESGPDPAVCIAISPLRRADLAIKSPTRTAAVLARAGLTVAGLLAAPGGVAGFEQTDLERLRQIGHCPACDLRGAGAAVRTQDRWRGKD
jgi:hypothetical protein